MELPHYEGRDPLPKRGVFAGVLAVTIAVLILVGVAFTWMYQRCTSVFWSDDWLYPGAQVVGETSQFLATQQRILLTQDSAAAIDAWYASAQARLMRTAIEQGDPRNAPQAPPYVLTADPAGGTRIAFTATCP